MNPDPLPPTGWPKHSDGEKVCWSESLPCHWLSLSEPPHKRYIFLERIAYPLYCQIDPCHMPGGSRTHFDRCLVSSRGNQTSSPHGNCVNHPNAGGVTCIKGLSSRGRLESSIKIRVSLIVWGKFGFLVNFLFSCWYPAFISLWWITMLAEYCWRDQNSLLPYTNIIPTQT